MDMMLTLTEDGLHEILWTDTLLAEWERVIVREQKRSPESAAKITAAIRDHFSEGQIAEERYIHDVASMPGNDPDDRHHMAAAIAGRAETIVTWNRKDFPGLELARHGIQVVDPDEYLVGLLGEAPGEVLLAVQRMAVRKRRPPMTVVDVVERLSAAHATLFAVRLRDLFALETSTDEPPEPTIARSGWLKPHQLEQRLAVRRPPPHDIRARVSGHEPFGRDALSRFIATALGEVLEHWPQGTVVIFDFRNGTYAQALVYPPHILTEIGPATPDRLKAATSVGWMDPTAFQARHADFASQPVWEDNPVREWEYGIDSLKEISLFVQAGIQLVLGADVAKGYRLHIFNNYPYGRPEHDTSEHPS